MNIFDLEEITFTPSAAVASILVGASVQLYTAARTVGELSPDGYDEVAMEDSTGFLWGETTCRLLAALAQSDDGVAIDPTVRETLQGGASRLLMSMRPLGLALAQAEGPLGRPLINDTRIGRPDQPERLNYTKNIALYRKNVRIQALLRTFNEALDALDQVFSPAFFPMVAQRTLGRMKRLVEVIAKSVVVEWTEPLPAKPSPDGQEFGRFQAQIRLRQKIQDSIVIESAQTAVVLYQDIKDIVGTRAFLERYKKAPVRNYTTPKDFGFDEDAFEEEDEEADDDENTIDEDE